MKRMFKLLLTGCFLSLTLFGCNNNPTESEVLSSAETILHEETSSLPDEEPISIDNTITEKEDLIPAYRFVLNSLYDALQTDLEIYDIDCIHFSTGITEVLMQCETIEERMNSLAYCIQDINNDGIDELLILDTATDNTMILDMYTTVEGTPVSVIEGWARNRCYLLNDGMIYQSGSGGAAYSIEKLLSLDANSYTPTSKALYFTYPKDDPMSECVYYYSPDGIYDPAEATEISSDDFWAFSEECESKIVSFEAKTFHLFNHSSEQ